MTIQEALYRFAAWEDRDELCPNIDLFHDLDLWPLAMAACASLSGMLTQADSNNDLIESIKHYKVLVNFELAPVHQLTAEIQRIFNAVISGQLPKTIA